MPSLPPLTHGYTVDRIHELTKIDRWFLFKLQNIMNTARELEQYNEIDSIPADLFRQAKQQGFSDFQIARSVFKDNMPRPEQSALQVRERRKAWAFCPW